MPPGKNSTQNSVRCSGSSLYSVKSANKAVRDAAEKYYEALRRALEMADGLDAIFEKHMDRPRGKYLVFTSNIEAMRTCMNHVSKWFGKVDPEPHIYSLYTLDRETLKSFDAFKADNDAAHLRLLFCIDALNEGIHVDDIDAELKEYYTEHGHCRLPVNYTDSAGQRLYIWLVNQKRSAKSGKMSEERKNRLRAVGALGE